MIPEGLRALGCHLRALTDADAAWQRALFAQSRAEFAWLPLPETARDALIAHQYSLQHLHFTTHHAAADFLAIEHVDQGPIGRWIVDRAYGEREVRIVDVALQPAWRGRGLGAALLGACQDEAAARGCEVTLHVAHHNDAARRLYERLGFSVAGDTGTHAFMRWARAA